MKRLYSLAVALGTAVLASAQITGISIESVLVHDGSIDPALDGYTTYRVYADLTNEFDWVSAVYGDAVDPLFLGCTGDIFQADATVNANFANSVNPVFFGLGYPGLEYDSWFTIGVEDSNGDAASLQSTAAEMAPALTLFNSGQGFTINDPTGASWFNLFPCSGTSDLAACAAGVEAFGGADNRVLLAQITATGDVYGMFNVQVFSNGLQANQQVATGLTFSTNGADVFGCTNVDAFNYDAQATIDDLSCVLPCTVAVQVNTVNAPTCNGDNDGLIQVSATGAQGADYFFRDSIPSSFDIADPSCTNCCCGNFGNLLAGTYTIYAVDAAGCISETEVEVPVTEEVVVSAALTQAVSCNGAGDAVLTVSETTGGSGDYQYYLSNNPTVITTQTEWTGLSGGLNLTVYAFDSNMCFGNSSAIQISNPAPVVVNYQVSEAASVVDASCANVADGQIYLVAYGGTGNITFSADGMTYGASPVSVQGGTYTITAQDMNGCIGTMASEVTVGPEAIDVNAMAMAELCFGGNDGAVSWAPEGGQGDYMYTFDGVATTSTSAADLAPGDYVVSVTDGDGCTETVTVTVAEGVEITMATESVDATCFGENDGEVTVTAAGGTGAFQYSENGNNFGGNNVFDGLLAGDYTFFAQDENGCVQTVDASVGEPDAIVVTAIISEGNATGEGSIDVFVEGGSLPYTYEWIGPGVSGQDSQDLEGISTGSYTIEVTDANGCSTTETFNITTDIQEIGNGLSATVYPNPSQGDFVVDIAGGFQGSMEFRVVDAQGRMVQAGQWVGTSGLFRTNLDLNGAEAGLYQLILVNNGRPSSIQLVKTN
jgi:hypothetical protein